MITHHPTKFPCLARPGIPGPLVEMQAGQLRWAKGHLVENRAIQEMVQGQPNYIGNITTTDPFNPTALEQVLLALENPEDIPEVWFWVHDLRTTAPMPFVQRLDLLTQWVKGGPTFIKAVTYKQIITPSGVREYETWCNLQGYAHATFVDPDAPARGDGTAPQRTGAKP